MKKKRKMSGKGQLLSQPFIVIFSLIVIALILIFGFRAIAGLLKTGEQVATVKFEQDFTREVDDIYTQPPGSNTRTRIAVPNGVKGVCVADLSRSADVSKIPYDDVKEVISVLGEVSSRNNVFFSSTKSNVIIEPLEIAKLKPTKIVCDNTLDGRLNLILENKGSSVDATQG